MKTLTIATRKSPLAMWQAEHIQAQLESLHPGIKVELLAMSTKGDKILDSPLSKIGGKGLFVKELEHALLNKTADIAVHSMKDVPMHFPEGLKLGPICKRHDPRDAFVSSQYQSLEDMPAGSIVGTSSLRRQCQIQQARPDLVIKSLRGNINTRMAKLDAGEYDAIILAASGMKRMGFESRIAYELSPEQSLPACGQGALGIELRSDDTETEALLQPLYDSESYDCVSAERAMNTRLNGGCQVPIAGYATLDGDELHLKGLVGSVDGKQMLYAEASGNVEDAEAIGIRVAEDLLGQGADKILEAIYAS